MHIDIGVPFSMSFLILRPSFALSRQYQILNVTIPKSCTIILQLWTNFNTPIPAPVATPQRAGFFRRWQRPACRWISVGREFIHPRPPIVNRVPITPGKRPSSSRQLAAARPFASSSGWSSMSVTFVCGPSIRGRTHADASAFLPRYRQSHRETRSSIR